MTHFRTTVLLSGRGSNFEALLKLPSSSASGRQIEFNLVLSDNPSARGLEVASSVGIPTKIVERCPKEKSLEKFNEELAKEVLVAKPDLIVLAGFMRVLTKEFIGKFPNKIINIHPSLLPSFRGLNAVKQALEAGVKYSGCTAHFVEEIVDSGKIIAQAIVPVFGNDTEQTLAERILQCEHRLLPAVVKGIANGEISLLNGKVVNAREHEYGSSAQLISQNFKD